MDGAKTMAKLVIAAGVVSVWTGVGPASLLRGLSTLGHHGTAPVHVAVTVRDPAPTSGPAPLDGTSWLDAAKPYCNAVEVAGYLRAHPFPADFDGSAHGAACLALAGHMEEARAVITGLPSEDRWRAAGVVFNAGHPAADAGDDVAAGPLMELVVDFWPNHYMALYHAGAARYQRGDREVARAYLEEFLKNYDQDDGWTGSARDMLAALGR